MVLDELKKAKKLIGIRQSYKAVANDKVIKAFVARDVEPDLIADFINLCNNKSIPITYVDSKKELGKACGIDVAASAAVILKE